MPSGPHQVSNLLQVKNITTKLRAEALLKSHNSHAEFSFPSFWYDQTRSSTQSLQGFGRISTRKGHDIKVDGPDLTLGIENMRVICF